MHHCSCWYDKEGNKFFRFHCIDQKNSVYCFSKHLTNVQVIWTRQVTMIIIFNNNNFYLLVLVGSCIKHSTKVTPQNLHKEDRLQIMAINSSGTNLFGEIFQTRLAPANELVPLSLYAFTRAVAGFFRVVSKRECRRHGTCLLPPFSQSGSKSRRPETPFPAIVVYFYPNWLSFHMWY